MSFSTLREINVHITDYLVPEGINTGLRAESKAETLDIISGLAAKRGLVASRDRLRQALEKREAIVTTGVGRGIAIPHADLPEIESPRILVGLFPDGVDFDSLDDEPVSVVFLLLGTPRTPSVHMKILARIARLSKDPEMELLRNCTEPDEARNILARVDDRH